MISIQAADMASIQGRSEGDSKASEASVGGDCIEYGWIPIGDIAPLPWWFSAGVVSSLAISVGSTSSVWVNSSLGW